MTTVTRVGGEYAAGQRLRARLALWGAAGIVGLSAVAASLVIHPSAGVLLVLGLAPIVTRTRRRLVNLQKGIYGEALVVDLLHRLPGDYFLLNDVMLPERRGNIDHVLIGPCGVVVLETKHWTGIVKSYGDLWFRNGVPVTKSVSKQVNGNAAALKDFLSRQHPDVAGSVLRFVESVVVFSNPLVRIRVNRARTTIVRYSQLLDVIVEKAQRKRVPADVAGKLAATLARISMQDSGPLRPVIARESGTQQG